MTDLLISDGKLPYYPAKHYGAHFIGNRATFCLDADFAGLDPNVLAIPNLPISVLSNTPVQVDAEFFGTHAYYRENDAMPGLTDRTVRSQDMVGGKSRWSKIEYSPGLYDWEDMDKWVDTHHQAGRDMLHVLWGTPKFYSARPNEIGAYGEGSLGASAEPSDMTRWSAYCTAVARRYVGKIKYYDVWNEPNESNNGSDLPNPTNPCYFTGTFSKLAEIVRLASQSIKAVDPGAKILCPAVTNWKPTAGQSAESYFVGMLNAPTGDGSTTMKDWVDIIAVHLYLPSPNRVQDLAGMIDRINVAKAAAGVSTLPTWDTESSMISPTAASYTDDHVCRFMSRFLITAAAKGIARTLWYQWDRDDDGGFGFKKRYMIIEYRERIKELLMSGRILTASRFYDGRVGYYTHSGLIVI